MTAAAAADDATAGGAVQFIRVSRHVSSIKWRTFIVRRGTASIDCRCVPGSPRAAAGPII